MLSGRIILIVAASNDVGNIFICFFLVLINTHRHLKIKRILLYLSFFPISWCKMADRQARQIQLLFNTSQTEQEYGTDGEIRIHICAWYAYFQSCCCWWNRRRRYYSNGCCSRIVTVSNCVRGPERFTTYQTFISIDCRYKLKNDWVRIWMHFHWDIGHHWHYCIMNKGLVWAREKKQCQIPSAIPSKTPARNHSASWLMNLVSSIAALTRPLLSSLSDKAKIFLPSLFLKETWIWLNVGSVKS